MGRGNCGCEYFAWIDPPVDPRTSELITGLLNQINGQEIEDCPTEEIFEDYCHFRVFIVSDLCICNMF